MTHLTLEERRKRRAAIAEAVRNGASPAEVAAEYGMTLHWVYKACAENGVHRTKMRTRTLQVIAALQNSDESMHNIANEFDITEKLVRDIAARAKRAGVRFPGR